MKKSIGLLMIVMAVISMAFVSCDANTAPQADTLGEIYLSNDSQSRGITVSGTNTHKVEDLYWYYKAAKNDNGLFNTGVTNGFVPVKTNAEGAIAGLNEANLGLFSYGNWTFTFYAFKTKLEGVTASNPASDESIISSKIVYSGSQTIEVNKDKNFLNLTLNEGDGLTTEIKFDTTEGVWFSNGNIKTGMAFSLAVEDKVNGESKGTINVKEEGTSVEEGKVSFKKITYSAPEEGIAEGQHVMTFTLTQTGIEGTTTNIAKVATFELPYTVSKGMTYTFHGDLTNAEVTGEVSVGSYAVSVPETTASKVIPVESAVSKVVKTETTVSTLDLTVKYPEGAVLDTTTETAVSGSSVTADATIGFVLDPDSTEGIAISGISDEQELTKYTLSLNVADTNGVLIEVSKFIGKDLEIEAVYHKGNKLPDDNGESYEYNPETGFLTLKVYNASPIDVVTKKALAVAKIGDEKFTTLQAAIEAAVDGDTITILKDVTNAQGIAVGNGVDFTIDFGGHTYTLNKPGAGSKGTETNGFQLKKVKDKTPTITFKNGTINISEDNLNLATEGANIKRIIQNYCNLNLIDMTIDGTNQYGGAEYVMSFNNGTVNISGNTNITAAEGNVAFDSDGNWGGYERSIVNIDTTGTIVGNIEVGQGYLNVKNAKVDGGIVTCTSCGSEETTDQISRISITGGTFSTDPSEYLAHDYVSVKTGDSWVIKKAPSIMIGEKKYSTMEEAVNAAKEGDVILLGEGEYSTYGTTYAKNKTLSFRGQGPDKTVWLFGHDQVFGNESGADYSFENSNVTFSDLTIQDKHNNANYRGFVRCSSLAFNNCKFNSRESYWGIGTVDFTNCTFNDTGDWSLWCYSGTQFNFNGCTFNTSKKGAINLYQENNDNKGNKVTVNVNSCVFNLNNSEPIAKPVIQVGEDYTDINEFTLNIVSAKINGNYAEGSFEQYPKYVLNKDNKSKNKLRITIDGKLVYGVKTV